MEKDMEQRFTAELLGRGPNAAWVFLPVPFNVAEVFGSKARVAVSGTLNGAPFRNSLLPNGDGTHSMPVNKELMESAKAAAGETVAVVMLIDKEPRAVSAPDDLKAVLTESHSAELAFEKLSYSYRKEYVDWINGAKKPDTRERRIQKSIEMLVSGVRLKGKKSRDA
jgi:Bacteriocin-protection, YdeI or OmpD-Associated/Domain of unknown function (DUF1905)